jgi:uncharacterized protein YndB with AHSA1/START domain
VRREFTLRRRVPAHPAQVWDAWTTPEQLTRFLFHPGVDVAGTSVELDLREGGRLVASFTDQDGVEYRATMTVDTVQSPTLLALSWPGGADCDGGQLAVTLSGVGADTLVHYRFTGEGGKQDLLAVRSAAVSSLDRLDAVVRSRRGAEV